MNNDVKFEQNHRDIALEFLSEANNQIENKVDNEILKKMYDLFAQERPEGVSFQRGIEKILEEAK